MQPLEPRRGLRAARTRAPHFSFARSGSRASKSPSENSRADNSSASASSGTSRSHTSTPSMDASRIPSKLIFRADHLAHTQSHLFRDSLLTLLLFLLLSEWLRPLAWMADESIQIGSLLVVFALCLAIDCFRIPYSWGWLAKCLIIVVFIGYMFDREQVLGGGWVIEVMRTFAQDFVYIVQGHFDQISGEMRTLLFLFGWSLLLSVVQALMLQRQHSLWFVMATLLYLVGIQLLLGADTAQGIIRTLGYGLLLMALLNLSRIEQTYRVSSTRTGSYMQWLMASIIIVGMLTGVGWLSAKQTDAAPLMKPVSWWHWYDQLFELYNEETGSSRAIATSGYGLNDMALGGPLQVDTTPIFTAKTPVLTYWRGESKSVYDGKGWTEPNPYLERFAVSTPASTAPVIQQEILLSGGRSLNKQVFAGGHLLSVDMLLTENGKPLSPDILLLSKASGKTVLPEIADPLSYYKITVQPVTEDSSLLNVDIASYPADIANAYLQLPSSLPRTVRSLAEQVTENRETPYAKAVAIEQYLSHTYAYSLEKPTLPSRNEDFVSHFLFVDQAGYCDHFSTAMVVMLRSVGVPARWVKGFAPGTAESGLDEQGLQEVIVRNNDAHSWVEVYFPSMGWVPFEPTPGYSAISVDQPRDQVTNVAKMTSSQSSSVKFSATSTSLITRSGEWIQSAKNNLFELVKAYRSSVFYIVSSLFVLVGLGIILRRQGYLFPSKGSSHDYHTELAHAHPLTPYMDRLWRQLFRKYGAKPANQTVREYVMNLQVTHPSRQQALLSFAQIYESVRYDPARALAYSKREIAAIWKAIQKSQ